MTFWWSLQIGKPPLISTQRRLFLQKSSIDELSGVHEQQPNDDV
jgi:hypothetical protein